MTRQTHHRGAANNAAGHAAEASVERCYLASGHRVLARRWRGTCGELDLICEDGEDLIFVEVKKARSLTGAALRLTERQIGRIQAAALEFLANRGEAMDRAMRFDLACVDALGRCEVIENALAA